MKKFVPLVAAACALFATAAPAQDFPLKPGSYWDMSMIEVPDEGVAPYADFLATNWKRQQEFAKSKGYIKEYHILQNIYKRPGEADMYLVTVYDKVPDAPELERQMAEYEKTMNTTMRKSLAESAGRAKIRKVAGSQMFQELVFTK